MTKENKQLLLIDLCARLPYGVIVHLKYDKNTSITRELGIGSLHDIMVDNVEGKPYLRPISSMTEEEKKEFDDFCVIDEFAYADNSEIGYRNQAIIMSDGIDYLNSIHIDYRGLIPMGLAIEVTKENNPYEEINL